MENQELINGIVLMLKNGMTISHKFKSAKKDWFGAVNLFVFSGYLVLPRIVVESPYGTEFFNYTEENLLVAAKFFLDLAHSPKNLGYRFTETVSELSLDKSLYMLSEDEFYKMVYKRIKQKIKNDRPTITR